MKTPLEYVTTLSNDDRIQMIRDHKQLIANAMIGDCVLRYHAEIYKDKHAPHASFPVRTMDELVQAVYQFYAEFYLESVGDLIKGT